MRLDKRVEALEGRVGPADRVDQIIFVGVERGADGELVEASRTVWWTRGEGIVSAKKGAGQ